MVQNKLSINNSSIGMSPVTWHPPFSVSWCHNQAPACHPQPHYPFPHCWRTWKQNQILAYPSDFSCEYSHLSLPQGKFWNVPISMKQGERDSQQGSYSKASE